MALARAGKSSEPVEKLNRELADHCVELRPSPEGREAGVMMIFDSEELKRLMPTK
jgi:hypothetical protein